MLWRSEHYALIPDGFPRCTGHLLLITRAHLPSHMHAPAEWEAERAAAQALVRSFLLETFAAASFYENGARRQEVPHAHLHALPFRPVVPPEWEQLGWVQPISGWADARRECVRAGHYFYLETADGCWLLRRYRRVLSEVRAQLVGQTDAAVDPISGKPQRGGTEMVARTIELWQRWRGPGSLPGGESVNP